MKISGYTFVRNAVKLAYPLKESIMSILDLVDEFVITYIEGDEDDNTLEIIKSINSDKIKIVKATWEPEVYQKNTLYSYLSDVAKDNCSGDWLFYLQVDEVVHEKDLPIIKKACQYYLNVQKIEGLLFNYKHFWGDYNHCFTHHGWYPKEIRIIRNLPEIHSWRDAQSFRKYDEFSTSTEEYIRKKETHKLKVAQISAQIFHYGWVRPPFTMSTKQNRMRKSWDLNRVDKKDINYEYGLMSKVPLFNGTHPGIMQNRISEIHWKGLLQYSGNANYQRAPHKHERLKYRIKSWIELNLLGGREIGGFKNYKIVAKFK